MEIEKIKEEIVDELLYPGALVTLNGSAGTGKTTLVKQIIDLLISKRPSAKHKIELCATTHQACEVLAQKTGGIVSTIHSKLGLKLKIHPKGDFLYQANTPPKHKIIIIDEASMISNELHKFITAEPTNSFLFVGDNKQLPPIGERESQIFNYKSYTLTKIWRQEEGNDNIDLSLNLDLLDKQEDGLFYKYITKEDVPRILDSGGTYLAWTNDNVTNVNSGYRNHLGYKQRYEVGETIIAQNNVVGKSGVVLKNGQRLKIESIRIEYSKFFDFEYFVINDTYKTPVKDNSFWRACSFYKKQRDWYPYKELRETYAIFKHRYAMTVHKSQGSTLSNVIINVANCRRNKDKRELKKLLYTALTRTNDYNYILI